MPQKSLADVLPHIREVMEECERKIETITNCKVSLSIKFIQSIKPDEIVFQKEVLQKIVSETFDVPWSDIIGKKRNRNIADARKTYIYICVKKMGCKASHLGREMKKDHTTVLYSNKTTEMLRCTNDPINEKINQVINKLYEQHLG